MPGSAFDRLLDVCIQARMNAHDSLEKRHSILDVMVEIEDTGRLDMMAESSGSTNLYMLWYKCQFEAQIVSLFHQGQYCYRTGSQS